MLFAVIVFFIALLGAVGMIAWRLWQLRTGRVEVTPGMEEADWTEISIESVRMRLVELLQLSIHYSALGLLKFWILMRTLIKRLDMWVHTKLLSVLHKNGHRPVSPDAKPSEFLQDITAHKEEISKSIEEPPSEQ